MKFFIDSAEINEIKELYEYGFIDGVTTNPSLVAKTGKDLLKLAEEICDVVKGPVSLEVGATDFDGMLKEGERLTSIAKNVVIKLPITLNGLKACNYFANKGKMVNLTLCFSAAQAILAAKAGAAFVSPFVGRLDDVGEDGLGLIEEICQIYQNYSEFKTEVLVASIRNPLHIVEAAKIGAHVATIPAKIISQLVHHSLTDKGLEIFIQDWKKSGQKIIS